MANLFSGLESLGLGNLSEMKLFEHKEKEKAEANKGAAQPVESLSVPTMTCVQSISTWIP